MITLDEALELRYLHHPERADWLHSECSEPPCQYDRHPCVVFRLADTLVTVLSRGGDRARIACPCCSDGDEMPAIRCMTCGTGYRDAGVA